MKTSELTGSALDWAVAKAEGKLNDVEICAGSILYGRITSGFVYFRPSANWAQGGPIIEREGLSVIYDECAEEHWIAQTIHDVYGDGPTPLIAAMRCFVASKLGDEVDVPDEFRKGE